MKTFKSFLTEADTSGATNTEMAICYQYNMLKFNDYEYLVTANFPIFISASSS